MGFMRRIGQGSAFGLLIMLLASTSAPLLAAESATGAAAPATDAASPPTGDTKTKGLMDSIFGTMIQVLPMSFDDETFRRIENRPKISALLKDLVDHVGDLERHGRRRERAFEFVAQSLRNDAKHLYRWYINGAFDEARFTLHNMTENCITCHSSLPENHKFPAAARFFKEVDVKAMHPLERAHYLVMSRQFDEALDTYEAFFKQADVPPSALATLGSFVDYLKINANVKQDLVRPRKFLESLSQRQGISPPVREQLSRWITALAELDKQGALGKVSLENARLVVNQGRAMMEYPQDRDGLIHYLVAGAILNRYVHSHPDQGRNVAEAYYLLGITESLLGHSFWISRSDYYLESAIRLAPGADFAPKAYDLLETSYTTSFSGSSGTHIPDDVKELLVNLRKLIANARGNKT